MQDSVQERNLRGLPDKAKHGRIDSPAEIGYNHLMNRFRRIFPPLVLLLLLPTCGRRPVVAPVWTAVNAMHPCATPELTDGADIAPLLQSLERSLAALAVMPDTVSFRFGEKVVTRTHLYGTLLDFHDHLATMGLTPEFFVYIKNNYRFYCSAARSVLYTGYFEPTLRGSRQKSAVFKYPLYGRPDDLVTVDLSQYSFYPQHVNLPRQIRGRLNPEKRVVPYWSRADIENGTLADRDLELIWIDDPLDVFFLHIQGSGRVLLDDGSEMRVGYAEQNGHPFRSIGRELIERGALKREQATMPAIRAWLTAHPETMSDILNANPSYIFFRETPAGPIGSSGVTITGGRSIATDNRLFPSHALCFVASDEPRTDANGEWTGWNSLRRFVLNQDTGGAIRGADRVDFFFGSGAEAGAKAGTMKRPGMLYFMLKKTGQ